MRTSGETAISTSGAAFITAIPADAGSVYRHIEIVNTGTATGFVNWVDENDDTFSFYVPAESIISRDDVTIRNGVKIKRATATDLSGVYMAIW